ncbi:hypothetical protein X946_3614 [Burkholderia sp. ABCPW 111]|nr:hypothetical protein X946_3614 [Burkholderia sp. ABCPW 111]
MGTRTSVEVELTLHIDRLAVKCNGNYFCLKRKPCARGAAAPQSNWNALSSSDGSFRDAENKRHPLRQCRNSPNAVLHRFDATLHPKVY